MATGGSRTRGAFRIGTLPRVGPLDQLRAANGEDGIVGRVRSNSRLVVAIAAAAVLLVAWIAWAIHVASSNGATAGLGVLLAWPAILVALALISLPFIGGYLLIRRLSDGDSSAVEVDAEESDAGDEEEESEDPAEEEDEPDESEDSDDEDEDSEEDDEAEDSEEDDEDSEDVQEEDEDSEPDEGDEETEEANTKKAGD